MFGGELNLVDYGGETTRARRLGEGQAARFDGKDFVTGIDSNPGLFVTRQELARRSRLERNSSPRAMGQVFEKVAE